MLSVLIPVYNYDVSGLVAEVYEQAKKLNIAFEVLVSDDGSSSIFTEKYSHYPEVPELNVLLNTNQGRAANRNTLAGAARFDHLLFIDSDVSLPATFIQKYVDAITCREEVVVGGILLASPDEHGGKYYFRRYFGSKREAAPLSVRASSPYHHFNSCNFMVSKSVFEKVVFNESIKTYGHEDTDFSASLKEAQISIRHIDNPLIHHPEDTFEGYLEKTESSIRNLVVLLANESHPSYSNIKLAQAYLFLRRFGLLKATKVTLNLLRKYSIHQLKRRNANLVFFDLYKLTLFLNICHDRSERKIEL